MLAGIHDYVINWDIGIAAAVLLLIAGALVLAVRAPLTERLIHNTGVLTGSIQDDETASAPLRTRPFNPNPDFYKPATVTGGSHGYALAAVIIVGLLFILVLYVTMVYGPIAAMLVELFPTKIRYTSMSLPYHIGNGWFGGLLPTTAFAMVAAKGDIYFGLWYPAVATAIAMPTMPNRLRVRWWSSPISSRWRARRRSCRAVRCSIARSN